MGRVESLRERALVVLSKLQWVAPLLGRLAVGLIFMSTGWGKLQHIDKVTLFFIKLGIPAAHSQAILVGYTELLCGTALVVGLLTRLATIPLIISMTVAIITAKWPEIDGFFGFVATDEVTYIAVLAMVAILGPGPISLDALLVRRLGWRTSPPTV